MEHQGKAALDRGTKLGKYGIERLIGVGSMGAVYEGVHREIGKRFAIKVLSPALAAAPTARARFLKEARLTAGLRHPHIVDVTRRRRGRRAKLLRDGAARGGGPLAPAPARPGRSPPRRPRTSCGPSATRWRRLTDAASRTATSSRRTSSSRSARGDLHPVVLDFGIAKDGEGASPGGRRRRGGRRSGRCSERRSTSPPNRSRDHQAASAASDQHALGVILYECLTGKPPYGGDSLEEVLRAIVAGNPAPPSTRRSDVPQSLDAVVRRALNSDPKRRFASVAELGLALYPFASKGPPAATPEPYRRPPTSPAIRRRGLDAKPVRADADPRGGGAGRRVVRGRGVAARDLGESTIPPIEASPALDSEPPLPRDLTREQASRPRRTARRKRAFKTAMDWRRGPASRLRASRWCSW